MPVKILEESSSPLRARLEKLLSGEDHPPRNLRSETSEDESSDRVIDSSMRTEVKIVRR